MKSVNYRLNLKLDRVYSKIRQLVTSEVYCIIRPIRLGFIINNKNLIKTSVSKKINKIK